LLILGILAVVLGGAASARAQGPRADLLEVKGPVTPMVASYIQRGIREAESDGAVCLIVQLDTPGGSVGVMAEIVQAIANARVPVVVYVAPSGAMAASAGTFVVLSGHVAAMAPGTTIGAAHPVGAQGEDLSETMKEKEVNALAAQVRALAQRRGEKALNWVEQAVRESVSATANEALELGVIDVIADDTEDLLAKLDGMTLLVANAEVTLHTREAFIRPIAMTPVEGFFHAISDPTIAYILLIVGINALILEFSSPGGFMAGVIGAICLLLGLYALGTLSVNYTGLLLIGLAFALFIAEALTPTTGALAAAGVGALVLGSMLLFDGPYLAVSRGVIAGVALATGGFFLFAVSAIVRARRRCVATGREALVGRKARVRRALNPEGTIFLEGELWSAVAEDGPIARGEEVEVLALEGFRLRVRRARGAS
jgi:membrane-bound serine protease (ClpP class)